MTQHTPGPWTVTCYLRPDRDDDPMGVYLVEPAAYILWKRYEAAEPETPELAKVHSEQQANTRLIAAVPEMLRFLREYADETETSKSLRKMEEARVLLAKVEGQG